MRDFFVGFHPLTLMCSLYSLVYLAPAFKERRQPEDQNDCVTAFYAAARDKDFPYDIGDDPAFFSARHHGGPVTWGVCRHDVRNAIQLKDWGVFFAVSEKPEDGTKHYQLVAALEVHKKIRHTELFETPYRHYLNLLIRPDSSGWQHHEPALHHAEWHKDWLWRAAGTHAWRTPACRKDCLTETRNHSIPSETVRKVLADPPENYVIFGSENAIRPQTPISVAEYRKDDEQERWFCDERTQRIKSLIFCGSRRGLRTTNVQQPHRHFHRDLADPDLWVQQFSEVIQFDPFHS